MALIKCSECGKEVSDKADKCISCGNPINHQAIPIVGKVEIERTNKKWKRVGCLSLIIAFIGLMVMSKSFWAGFSIIIIAVIVGKFGQIGAWWNNG